ncbi:MAG: diaminopimelate dehydrogenase [Coriobacteriales bacterium]|jgi:diaminopimelate dehydrogenase|nr:diaminopimelate dehydrogenase [Coriobacteriales bacterium]
MSATVKVGIVGYGNLGRGVQAAVSQNDDMELVGVFTRRDPSGVVLAGDGAKVYHLDTLAEMKNQIDVLILCGGSATDLPEMTPRLARDFNVIDSFDTHAKIPEHFAAVDRAAKAAAKVAIISVGWDPGLFSLNKAYAQAILPSGTDYSFWGTGVSQGHSDAIRRIKGVIDARQYTIPVEEALDKVRAGENPQLTTREKHTRLCYVVVEEGVDTEAVTHEIVTMPYYFDEYDTEVRYISAEEMKREHSSLPHGGMVLRSGRTGFAEENTQIIEYKLQLDSNPEFTSSVLLAYARAACRLSQEGQCGCKTVLDIAPTYLLNKSAEDQRSSLL